MSAFFGDVWADLRAKRLWPVAIVLAAALVAVPVLLLEPAAEPPPAPATSSSSSSQAPKSAVALAGAPAEGSRLGTFRAHDPFVSKADAPPSADGDSATSGDGDGGSATIGAKPTTAGSTLDPTVPDSGGGSTGSSGGSGGGSGGGTQLYTYTVDVRFGRQSSERRYDDVKRMALLPNDRNPMLVYLGASVSGDEVVFLVDSSLSQSGEGVCKPNADACSFLYMRAADDQNDHSFADAQGRRYNLEVLAIQQKRVSSKASSSRRRGTKAKRATARKSAREFLFRPFLLDATRR